MFLAYAILFAIIWIALLAVASLLLGRSTKPVDGTIPFSFSRDRDAQCCDYNDTSSAEV